MSRFVFTERFVRAAAPSRQAARIAGVLALNGVMMAIPLVAFEHFNAVERAAVSIVLLATATASAATTAGYRDVFLAFALPMLVPLAIVWVVAGSDAAERTGSWGLGLLILAFLGFLVSIGRQVNKVFEDASRYRHGEQQLTRELQAALEQADELNRAKTRFLAAASHDLRQPIHGITVLVAALGLRALDPRSREIVGHLDTVNQLLSTQLDSLLDISRLDAGIVRPEPGLHALDGIVRPQAEALAPVAAAKGIRLALGRLDRVVVRTDPALLGRVLGNLADNALKFTPAGGRIEFSVVRDGDRARVTVADTGIGIPAAEHGKVFREFYQVGGAGRDRAKGLGLGLSIVRRLSDLLGASLSLESREGAGTVVTVSLPALPRRRRAVAGARHGPERRADAAEPFGAGGRRRGADPPQHGDPAVPAGLRGVRRGDRRRGPRAGPHARIRPRAVRPAPGRRRRRRAAGARHPGAAARLPGRADHRRHQRPSRCSRPAMPASHSSTSRSR